MLTVTIIIVIAIVLIICRERGREGSQRGRGGEQGPAARATSQHCSRRHAREEEHLQALPSPPLQQGGPQGSCRLGWGSSAQLFSGCGAASPHRSQRSAHSVSISPTSTDGRRPLVEPSVQIHPRTKSLFGE